MIAPRLRSEARGGALTSGTSTRYSSSGIYGGKIHHANDPDLKRALHNSYASQAVKKWEKRWVTIHETSMRVHKWMPAPASSQNAVNKIANTSLINKDLNQEQQQPPPQQQQIQPESDSLSISTQETQMMLDDESTSQSSLN